MRPATSSWPFGWALAGLLPLLLVAGSSARASSEEPVRILVMDLEHASGISADDARTLTDLLAAEAARFKRFRTVSQADLRTMVALEGERESVGCNETSCLAEVAGAIGARFVVYGRVSRLGRLVVMQLNVLDSEQARPLGREAVKADDLGAAADALPGAVERLLRPAIKLAFPEVASAREAAAATNQAAGAAQGAAHGAAQQGAVVDKADEKGGPKAGDKPKADVVVAKAPDASAQPAKREPEPPPTKKLEDPKDLASRLQLEAGEVPEQTDTRSTVEEIGVKGLAGTRAVFLVDAPKKLVLDALWRPEEMHEVLPGGKKSSLKREGKDKSGRRWVEVTLSEKAVFVKLEYTARLMRDDRAGVVSFEELDGDIKHVRGSFLFKEAEDPAFTEVIYTVYVDVGMMVPSSWARTILSDQPTEMAEVLRTRVREAREKAHQGKHKKSELSGKNDDDASKKKRPSKKRSKKRRTKKKS